MTPMIWFRQFKHPLYYSVGLSVFSLSLYLNIATVSGIAAFNVIFGILAGVLVGLYIVKLYKWLRAFMRWKKSTKLRWSE